MFIHAVVKKDDSDKCVERKKIEEDRWSARQLLPKFARYPRYPRYPKYPKYPKYHGFVPRGRCASTGWRIFVDGVAGRV